MVSGWGVFTVWNVRGVLVSVCVFFYLRTHLCVPEEMIVNQYPFFKKKKKKILNINHKHPAWFWCLFNSPSCEEGRAQVLRGASEVQPRAPDAVPLPPLWHHGQRVASHSFLILCRNNGGKWNITLQNEDGCFVFEALASQQLLLHLREKKLMAFLSCLKTNPLMSNNLYDVGLGSCKYITFLYKSIVSHFVQP